MKFVHAALAAALMFSHGSDGWAANPPVTALTFSADGQTLVAATQKGLASYNWPDLRVDRRVSFTTSSDSALSRIDHIHDIKFAPSGKLLAIAGGSPSESGSVITLSWPELNRLDEHEIHSDSIMSIRWRNSEQIATAGMDHAIFLSDLQNAETRLSLEGHSKGVTSICFLMNGGLVVSGALDHSIRVWETNSGQLLRSLSHHTGPINDIAKHPSHQPSPMIASASSDQTVRFWQPSIGRMVRFCRLSAEPIVIDWIPNGEALAVGCVDGSLHLINPDTAKIIKTVRTNLGWIFSMAIHPNDGSVALGGSNGMIQREQLDHPSQKSIVP